jgi:hypothetical protein
VRCGFEAWTEGRTSYEGGRLAQFRDEPVAACFAWLADDRCEIRICATETPFQRTLRLTFAGDEVRLEGEANVAFGPTKQPVIGGKAK